MEDSLKNAEMVDHVSLKEYIAKKDEWCVYFSFTVRPK